MRIFNETYGYSNLLGKAGKSLMMTTAMTAVGLLSIPAVAQAANDFGDHTHIGGSAGSSVTVTVDAPNSVTNIDAIGSVVKVQGDGDLKSGWTANINQDNSSAKYVLYDIENGASIINGNINANGHFYVFDQDGVIFGANSVVNVGSIIASSGTLTSTSQQLDDGKVIINSVATDGDVINRGTITAATGGLAALVAPNQLNSGVINARLGTVAMVAGQTVTLDMYGDGLVEVAVNGELADGLVKSTGDIKAFGGNVVISAAIAKNAIDDVINMSGLTTVNSAVQKGGKIILSGGSSGRVNVRGTVQASGSTGSGQDAGSIDITGERVRIADTARLRANADANNNAGDINVIADKTLILDGRLTAQGLTDTGFIETSAPIALFGVNASILATREWLLDPTDVTVDAPLAALVEGQLALGDMTIQTPAGGVGEGDIDVDVVVSWATNNAFNLIAHDDVRINGTGGINATGAGSFSATGGGDIDVDGAITTQGGDVTFVAGVDGNQDDINIDDDIHTNGGNFSATAGDDIRIRADLLTGGGDVTLTTLDNTYVAEVSITAAGLVNSAGGNITINSDDVRITESAGTYVDAGTGAVNINRVSDGTIGLGAASGDTEITQGELDSIAAATLNIGNSFTTGIDVDGVDTSANISGLTTLNALATGGEINFLNTNAFNALDVNSSAKVNVIGAISTTGGDVDIDSQGAVWTDFLNVEGSGSIESNGGKITLASNAGGLIIKGNIDAGAGDIDLSGQQVQMVHSSVINGNLINFDATRVFQTGTSTITADGITGTSQSDALFQGTNNDITNVFDFTTGAAHWHVGGFTLVDNNGVNIVGAVSTTGGDVALTTTGDLNVASTGSVLTGNGNLAATSNTLFDVDAGAIVNLGTGNAHIDAPDINLGADIVTTGTITGTALTVDVENDTAQIQDGVDVAAVNATVTVAAGTFAESVDVNKNGLQLLGANAGIHGSDGARGPESLVTPNSPGFYITANGVLLDGFAVDGADNGVLVDGANNVTVRNNNITNSTENGIKVVSSNDGFVQSNNVSGTGHNGIAVIDSNNATINLLNIVDDTSSAGIALNRTTNSLVDDNEISNTGGSGVWINEADGSTVSNNEIDTTWLNASRATGSGVHVKNTAGADILANDIDNTGMDGIHIEGGSNALIENNKIGLLGALDSISENGIAVEASADAILRGNKIRNTKENGIDVDGSANAQILANIVNDTGDDGIDLDGSINALIEGNKIGLLGGVDNIGDDGIDIEDSAGATIHKNKIQNTVENGIDVRGSDNTDITENIIRVTGGHGVYVNPSDNIRILDNIITDAGSDGIRVNEGYDIRVRRNTIRRAGDDGIDITKNDRVRVTGNTVVDTKKRGISVERAKDEKEKYAVVVHDNTVKDTGRTAIVVDRFTTAKIVDNTVRDSDRAGIRAQRGDYVRLRRNDVNGTKREGIKALGIDEVEIRRNQIRNARWDGILVDDFSYAWIGLNDVRNTGDDGIHASNGEVVAIYDNLIRKAGFFEDGKHADEAGADAIYVSHVGDEGAPVTMASATSRMPLTENGFNVEVIGNDVHKTYDDGVEVVDSGSTWVSENILTQIGFGIGEFGPEYYEGGDHYGADAVHLRNVKGLPYGLRAVTPPGELPYNRKTLNGTELREADLQEATPTSELFPEGAEFDYASVVINNQIKRTADDGVEIIGSEDITTPVAVAATATPAPTMEPTGRTVVAWNDIRHVGYGDIGGDGSGDGGDGLSYGSAPDGFGADAVHVRDIHSTVRRGDGDGGDGDGCGMPTATAVRGSMDTSDFAVEILENYIWNAGDDGVEVRESGRTRVANNEIYNVGLDTTDTPAPTVTTTSTWDDRGANNGDGIHIEHVYAGSGHDKKMAMAPGSFGNSVEILGNIIDHSGDDGVEVHYSGRTLVAENIINNSGVGLGHSYGGGDEGYGHDAIHVGGIYDDFDPYFGPTNSVVIRDNIIDTTGDDGVEVHYAGRTLIIDNEISHVGYGGGMYYGYGDEDGADAINVMHIDSNDNNAPFSVDIRRNIIDVTADDGIEVAYSGRTRIRNNDLTNIGHGAAVYYGGGDIYGADGIHVRNVNSSSERPRQMDVRIINNRVTDTGDDGIEVVDTDRVTVKRNTVDQASDDGIVVLRHSSLGMPGMHMTPSSVRLRRAPSKAVIANNIVTNSGTPFPDETVPEFKSIRRPGGDGIEVGGFDKIIFDGNDVSNSVENGLNVSGPNNGTVEVSGNTFTDNDTGALFQSGEIDLTGERNFFNGGRVGMRFAPAEMRYVTRSLPSALALPMDPVFADMSLVGNTIGAQTFDDQSKSFVELDNGAFFNPGTPTLLNALDSTYVGTPFGTFTPSVDYAAGFPVDVVAYLESQFVHFNDNGTTGLFFFPLLAGIDQEDIFNYFGPYSAGLSGLNVTILGLPGIPGGAPVALNNIAPAAGADTSPAALNSIETAAGGEESSCWSDALNAAGSGQSATVSYGGSAEDLLSGEANCGS